MLTVERHDASEVLIKPELAERLSVRLFEGALMVYPTDTLYGLGCRALDGQAVARLREAKGREADKALPVIITDLDQARSLSSGWPDSASCLAEAFWPGPLTMVVPASEDVPKELLGGASTIAIRVPSSEVARLLARLSGPLVATSANLAGEPPCLTIEQAIAALPLVGIAIDAGPLSGAPSTIVDLAQDSSRVVILREGRIDRARIEAAWRRP